MGKQAGVMAAAWLAVKLGWAEWPAGATPGQIFGVAVLCDIGFTMSLFIGGLAFESGDLQKDRKSTRLNSSHIPLSRMPSSA